MKKYVVHFKGLLLNPFSGPEREGLQYRQRWNGAKFKYKRAETSWGDLIVGRKTCEGVLLR